MRPIFSRVIVYVNLTYRNKVLKTHIEQLLPSCGRLIGAAGD